MTRIGILGAGKLGTVLAGLAARAGHDVRAAASGDPKYVRLNLGVYAPGAVASTADEAVDGAEIVILAVPLHRVADLSAQSLAGKVVIDATNHWEDVDGPLPEFTEHPGGTSVAVASRLPGAAVVKTLNHVGYEDLDTFARTGRRLAIGIASNHRDAADAAAAFVASLGFEPVLVGGLDRGVALQPGSLAFGTPLTAVALARAVEEHRPQHPR